MRRLNTENRMTGSDIKKNRLDAFAMARAAGLDKAVEQFPDCVADAAKAAAADLDDMPPIEGTSEPWSPTPVRRDR
jgi:hypothetical protein